MNHDTLWRYSQYAHWITLLGVIGVLGWGVFNVMVGDDIEMFTESFAIFAGAVAVHMISSATGLFLGLKSQKQGQEIDGKEAKMTLYSCGVGAVGGAVFLIVIALFG